MYLLNDGSESAVATVFRLDRVLTILNGLFISQNNTITTHAQQPDTVDNSQNYVQNGNWEIQWFQATGRDNVEHGL